MPDLLSHVLVAYTLFKIAAWWFDSITDSYVVVGMGGALLPDLTKLTLLVRPYDVTATFGIPFSWLPLHRLGGVLVSAGLVSLLVERRHRAFAFAVLIAGATSHIILDMFVIRPGPGTYDLLYPLTNSEFPSLGIGLYHSFDRWPVAVSLILAVLVTAVTRATGRYDGTTVDQQG